MHQHAASSALAQHASAFSRSGLEAAQSKEGCELIIPLIRELITQ